VKRGLDRREPELVKHLSLGEKSFKKGYGYIALLNDLDDGRVLDMVEERTIESKYLNEFVSEVRQEESQELSKQGDKTLVYSKFS